MADTQEEDGLGGQDAEVPEEVLAAEELARITPSNAELLKLASERPPAAEWTEGDEDRLM